MSSPIIWIVFPFSVGILLFFVRRWYRLTVLIGTIVAGVLAIAALLIPVNELIRLGPVTIKISDTLTILGRRLFLSDKELPLLAMIYIIVVFWFCAAFISRPGRMFVPLGLILIATWIAALAVQPFLYAALLLELAVLISIPILSPPGEALGRGVIRYLIFQSFGMPFILMTGSFLSGVESSPDNVEAVIIANTLLGFGLLFLMAIFPFHSWVPMLSEESHPYAIGFILFFLPLFVALFGLNFLNQYGWLRQADIVYDFLSATGVIMTLVGGVWAALQIHLGRLMGFAAMSSIGLMLLAISTPGSLDLFFAMQIPRALGIALWSLSLSILQQHIISPKDALTEIDQLTPSRVVPIPRIEALLFRNVQGIAYKLPICIVAITVSILSISGYPILGGFPIFQALLRNTALETPNLAVMSLIGSVSLGVAGLRSLYVMMMDDGAQGKIKINEPWITSTFLIVSMIVLIILGFFPQWILPLLSNLALVFEHLSPATLGP